MEIVLEITGLSRSGPGVGREASGRVVFVPFTAPGDQVRVEIVSEDKRYAEGRVIELLRSSEQRSQAPCPVFGSCGGCEWQHIPYNLQWDTKKSGVIHALERVGIKNASEIPWVEFPAEKIWEYRNRIQLRGFGEELGFYARSSKKLVPIHKCWIARSELNEKLAETKESGKSRPREYKAELEVHENGSVTTAWNEGHSARGFRQVHDEQNEKLRAWVADSLSGSGTLLDLYGGQGNLSLSLSARFQEIHCVDISSPVNRPANTPANYRYHPSGVAEWLKRYEEKKPVSVILDPPREGLGSDMVPILEKLKALPAKEILSIGCEPDAWARSASRMVKYGWHLEKIGALDFFPQTHHIESLAIFRR
jgi:23S rRNA (uracil1939-C5)-methyltransferase